MYDIKALEEEWIKYHRKKRRPWYIVLGVLALLSVVSFLVLKTDLPESFTNTQKTKSDEPVAVIKRDILIDGALNTLETKEASAVIDAPIDPAPLLDREERAPVKTKRKKRIHIEVIDAKKSTTSLREIAKRFRLGHDTDDSLFLAKTYYRQGKYKKAAYWALQTNKVNENIEESWLIFAKAKVKSGQRNEAIRILNTYIKRTRSVEAKVLLKKIKRGSL